MTLDLSSYKLDNPQDLANAIAFILDNKKGIDIQIIDLKDKTAIADYFVIASATSTTAVKALAGYVDEQLDRNGIKAVRIDDNPKWIAMDYSSVIVHIFYEETRQFYDLERLWK